jgi:two-component system, OmpR family, phosphate regulon sensor histidine kinase PhoR
MRMNNEIARLDPECTPQAADLLDENMSDIDRVNEMLTNLLLFDRMRSIETLHFEEVDLGAVARTATSRLSELALQKKITIKVTDDTIPPVHASRTALEQVFFNVLKNALSYTNYGGEVTITYRGVTGGLASVSIADSGVGIPATDLPHIFEPFYRSKLAGKLSGTGIGLAVVYEIIKIHKGTVAVESVQGKGTTFLLSLPLFHTAQALRSRPIQMPFLFSNTKRKN